MAVNYNIVDLSIDGGLDRKPIASGKNYLILLEAPANANVRIRFDDNTADEIPLDTNYAIETKEVTRVYVSADDVTGGSIKIGQSASADDFKILTAPVIDSIGAIAEVTEVNSILDFDSILLDKLDKIANPYEQPTFLYAGTNSGSQTTLIEKILTCDKITVILNVSRKTDANNRFDGLIYAEIDGQFIASAGENGNGNGNPIQYFTLENINGKTLKIRGCRAGDANITASFTLQEYTLKT